MKQILVTADDFGLDEAINEAVERGYCEGVLSCASLMTSAAAASDAVARARRLPGLRVGLHLVLVDGASTLPPDEIPALVDSRGRFSDDLFAAGVHWFFSPAARRQLAAEIRAQFEAFRATGLALDHVNAHNHMHIHPTVLSHILRLAPEFGACWVRLPYEPLRLTGMAPCWRGRLAAAGLAPWIAVMRRRLQSTGLAHNNVLIGLRATGHMTEDRLLALLARLPDGLTEVYCHPAVAKTPRIGVAMADYDNVAEFDAIVSPRIAEAARRIGFSAIVGADTLGGKL